VGFSKVIVEVICESDGVTTRVTGKLAVMVAML
jgi:hypothetical protein